MNRTTLNLFETPELTRRILKCEESTNGKELDISDMDLYALPEKVYHLSELRTINLRNNRIEILPSDFTQLFPSLQILNLSSNRIKALPGDFGMLKFMKKLYLGQNRLEAIPESIAGMRDLEELYLQNNCLHEITEAVSNLSNLKTLSVANNKILKIPASLTTLEKLSVVDLSGNTLSFVPEKIRRLHDKHLLLHSQERRRELITRANRIRKAVNNKLSKQIKEDKDKSLRVEV